MDFPPENVNNQASIRTRGVPASVSSSEPSSFTFDDVGALLRYVGNITNYQNSSNVDFRARLRDRQVFFFSGEVPTSWTEMLLVFKLSLLKLE